MCPTYSECSINDIVVIVNITIKNSQILYKQKLIDNAVHCSLRCDALVLGEKCVCARLCEQSFK